MSPVQGLLLACRVLLETGVVAGLARSGYVAAGGGVPGVLLAILAPAVGFGLWGGVDFHRAGRIAERLRLVQELVISGVAAAALIATGHTGQGWALLGLSLIYHALVYAAGERLLKPRATRPPARPHRPAVSPRSQPGATVEEDPGSSGPATRAG